jgi:hypothetical protein
MDEYESLATRNESANTTLFSSRRAAGRFCTRACVKIWAKCSVSWPSRKRAESRKEISDPILWT